MSCRSGKRSIGRQRPAVPRVAGMFAQEPPPDFDVPVGVSPVNAQNPFCRLCRSVDDAARLRALEVGVVAARVAAQVDELIQRGVGHQSLPNNVTSRHAPRTVWIARLRHRAASVPRAPRWGRKQSCCQRQPNQTAGFTQVIEVAGGPASPDRGHCESVTLQFRLALSGPLPKTIAKPFHTRFGVVDLVAGLASTIVTGIVDDQPALRALLGRIGNRRQRPASDTSVDDTVPSPAALPTAFPEETAIKEDR